MQPFVAPRGSGPGGLGRRPGYQLLAAPGLESPTGPGPPRPPSPALRAPGRLPWASDLHPQRFKEDW